jgi:sn-glycerol 3-phosphate transport system permease protein
VFNIYQYGFNYYKIGLASAMGVVLMAIIGVCTMLYFLGLSRQRPLPVGRCAHENPRAQVLAASGEPSAPHRILHPVLLDGSDLVKTLGQTLKMPPVFCVDAPQCPTSSGPSTPSPSCTAEKQRDRGVSILACQAVTVIPAAYAFARFRFKFSGLLFGMTLATMMIPGQLIFLPVFLLFSKMGLINSYLSLILPEATSAFAIFMLRQSFKQVPQELIEAARLDKAGEFKIMFRLMLPIARPTIATLAMLTFIGSWNDYFWPLVFYNHRRGPDTAGGHLVADQDRDRRQLPHIDGGQRVAHRAGSRSVLLRAEADHQGVHLHG